jgi:HPt (histidine-containing phosphotransfer) domain-containing protein
VDSGELKLYFAGRLPLRVAEVEAARDAARGAGWTGEPLRTFHRLAHSLAGAGATFGFPEVTEVSHRLESLLESAISEETPPLEGEVDGLLRRLRELAPPPEPSGSAPAARGSRSGT